MATNFLQVGLYIDVVAPSGGVTSGQGYLHTDIFGVAMAAAAETEVFSLALTGVWSLPKATANWLTGAKLYWDNTAKKITNVATSNKYIGVATKTVVNGDANGEVRLGQTADSNLDVATIADVVTALEALSGASRLSADALKDGTTNHVFLATQDTKLDAILASKLKTITYTVLAGDDTANLVDLDTGFGAAPELFTVQIVRAGKVVSSDPAISALAGGDAGKVRIADGASYVLTTNDVIHLFAIKV